MTQPHIRRQSKRSAFTLVEIAIVMVVVGLLVGGVLQGKAVLDNARLQSVVRDLGKYRDAYNQFVLMYKGKPGDITNATDIWGSAGGATQKDVTDAMCVAGLGTPGSTATCNGDGNGYIGGPYKADTTLTNNAEVYAAWQQLSAAGLIDGTYTGAAGGGATPGVNVPASQMAGSGYVFVSQASVNDATSRNNSPNYFDGDYGSAVRLGSFIIFGALNTTANGGLTDGEFLNPSDAYSVDKKTDDGLPAEGMVMTYLKYPSGVANSCVVKTGGGALAAGDDDVATGGARGKDTYNTTAQGRLCNLIYITDATK